MAKRLFWGFYPAIFFSAPTNLFNSLMDVYTLGVTLTPWIFSQLMATAWILYFEKSSAETSSGFFPATATLAIAQERFFECGWLNEILG